MAPQPSPPGSGPAGWGKDPETGYLSYQVGAWEPGHFDPSEIRTDEVGRRYTFFSRKSRPKIWAGDIEQKLFRNLELVGPSCMVTLTAPGADDLPWDEDHCAPLGPHRHSGPLGCRVKASSAEVWNKGCGKLWSGLWNDVQTVLRRRFGSGAFLAAYVWEMQARGVWHLHLLLGYEFPEREKSDCAVELLEERVTRHGFGVQVQAGNKSARHLPGQAAAAYFAKYFLGSTDSSGKRPLHETVTTSVPPGKPIVYVSRRLSAETGITMRALRHKRWLFWRIPNLHVWLAYVKIEALYEAVREGWWKWRSYRAELLGLDPITGFS